MKNKRYGVIIEAKPLDEKEATYKFVKIAYYNSLKQAREFVEYVNNYEDEYIKYRVFGVFDYQKAIYKYIVREA